MRQLRSESSEQEVLRERAIINAAAAAKEKAELLAAELGVTLGRVLTITEGTHGSRDPFQPSLTSNRVEMAAFDGSSGSDYEQISFRGQVRLTIALE